MAKRGAQREREHDQDDAEIAAGGSEPVEVDCDGDDDLDDEPEYGCVRDPASGRVVCGVVVSPRQAARIAHTVARGQPVVEAHAAAVGELPSAPADGHTGAPPMPDGAAAREGEAGAANDAATGGTPTHQVK